MKTSTRVSLFILAGFIIAGVRLVDGATYVVTNTLDNGGANPAPGAGTGTLRQAIVDANANSGVADMITFTVTGTILLESALPNLNDDVAITGPGANVLTVKRGVASAFRIFTVNSGKTVTISNLTVTGGSEVLGGGIYNAGTLTVNNCTVSANFGNGGGGIANDGAGVSATLTVNNSTISGNSGYSGGGILDSANSSGSATATINNSTIDGNTVGNPGGGITIEVYSGGTSATVTINNSTISGNSAPATGADGIFLTGDDTTLTIGSTILKGGGSGSNISNAFGGTVVSLGYNLSSDNSGNASLNQTGDQNNIDPLLGPLAYYGGPTQTHILLTGSPAINKGKNFSGSMTDQRGTGFPRTVGSAAVAGGDGTDIGAFERQPNDMDPTLIVTTTDDTNANNTCDPANPCSLRDAITAANASGPDDVIYFAVTGVITMKPLGALPNLDSNMKILGPGANALTVQRGFGTCSDNAQPCTNGDKSLCGNPATATCNGSPSAFRIFTINSGKIVAISGLTITNGDGATGFFPYGGGIKNDQATLTVSNCTISGNSAPAGGGISNFGDSGTAILTINNSTISGNTAPQGGGIFNAGIGGSATLTIKNSTISGNSTTISGGGIYQPDGTVTLESTIAADSTGGDIVRNTGTLNAQYSLIEDMAAGTVNGTNANNVLGTDPMLDPAGLQDNGGPTLTIKLLGGSPAIDKGKDFTGSPNDQRGPGFARTSDDPTIMSASGGDGTDIGAFEVQQPCPQVLTATVNDSVTGTGLNQWDYTSGGWSYYTASNFFTAYQKDEHYAPTAGTKAHFRFHGNQVKIYTVKEPAGGFIHYTLDGGSLDDQLVDNYSASQTGNTLSYTSPIVPVGDHDLVIEVNGTHGAGSSNTITVDKAEVYDAVCAPPPVVQALAATINDNEIGTGNNQFDYTSGGWSYYSNNSFNTAFQKDEHYAFTTGVFALFRFNGTQVKVYTVKEPAGGNIRYTLDGGTDVQTIDNYSPTQMGNTLSYTSPVVSSGNHVLKIEVLGTHNMGSSNTITIDKAEVYISSVGPSLTATINDNTTGNGNNQFDYSGGGWNYYSNPGFTTAFQMDEHYAFGTGVLAHFRFNGTQVKIYTVKEPAGGRIRYVLDTNVDIQTISNYSPTQVGNSLSYTSPVVPAGNHDLIIQVDGTHEPSASSNTITVDKAEVYSGP